MQLSKYNILAPIEGSGSSVIVNLLSGSADVLDAKQAQAFTAGVALEDPELVTKGYVVNEADETQSYRRAYLDFIEGRDSDEVQLFYVPSYSCNFNCSYCYQNSYEAPKSGQQDDVLGAFFTYIDRNFASRRKYVTLFGGEPLLPNEGSARALELLVSGTLARKLDLAIVTNGFHLER